MSGRLLLGIDGGASRCRARLRDQTGALLGEGEAGAASLAAGIAPARAAIEAAAAAALRAAGMPAGDLSRCHAGLGLAGAGLPEARRQLLDGWSPFAALCLETDAHIAWLGAHGGDDGAVLLLGTGSIALGQAAGARRHVLGGWGPELSDEGGGVWIGREALRRSLWAWDGRIAQTPLTRNLLAMFDGSPLRLTEAARRAAPAEFAAQAPLVVMFAAQGDPTAAAILHEAASHAARMIQRLADLGYERIALMGGLAAPLEPWLPGEARERLTPPRSDAVEGAILLARQAAEIRA